MRTSHACCSRRGRTFTLAAVALIVLALAAAAAEHTGPYPGWLPAGEASPFFPDDGWLLRVPGCKQAYLRSGFDLATAPRRAVVAVTGFHTVAVVLNGTLVLETHAGDPDRPPRFADVTAQLRAGRNDLDLRVWSEWTPTVYLQLRIEAADGSFRDVVTDAAWECRPGAAPGWPRGPAPADGWQPAESIDDYYGTHGRATGWDKEFALMPRALLQARLAPYNDGLRAAWTTDRQARRPPFRGPYTKPEYAAAYGAALRLEPATGQVVDATGTVRHLFFTIYGQKHGDTSTLDWSEFDFDRLEEDLTLMEAAAVHPYLRFVGWSRLLAADGQWRRCDKPPRGTGLPTFTYTREVLDYFLDRCQAHGRFVAVECDFFWAANWDTLPAPYHTRYYLYPEVTEANALAHRRILARYADSAVIAGFMIGEEDIIMAPDLDNGHLRTAFQGFLRGRYGTPDRQAAAWQRGYDVADHSLWRPLQRRSQRWGPPAADDTDPTEAVVLPASPLVDGYWAARRDWSEFDLPVWPRLRAPNPPHAELPSHQTFPGDPVDTDDDPVWIDYNTLREDELYLRFVSRWAELVREAVPNHWLFHSNAQDFTGSWHFLNFDRRAELPFPVIGVGSHDSGLNLADIPPWDRIRKYVSVIASYRPYVRAPDSPAVAVSCGEGEGGRNGDEDAILDYYRGQSLEMVGHGAAFEQSYTWLHLSGGDVAGDGRGHLTKALEWMGRFYRAVDGVTFPLPREVPALIVRHNRLQRSNRAGRDFGNALGLLSFLARLNLETDVVMDQDLAYGAQPRKVDLGAYRVVFLPCLECDFDAPAWEALDAWLSDPAHAGTRTLVLGGIGKRTPYLAPTPAFHPTLARWLGSQDYAGTVMLRGPQTLTWQPPAGSGPARSLRLHIGERGDITPTGVFAAGEPLLLTADGRPITVASRYAGNRVFAFGFPLGLAFDNLWGMPCGLADGKPAPQEPDDVLATLYDDLLTAAAVPRPIRAPNHVRLAVSADRRVILAREWWGRETSDLGTLDLPAGAAYEGAELVPQPDGSRRLRARLPAYGGLFLVRRP